MVREMFLLSFRLLSSSLSFKVSLGTIRNMKTKLLPRQSRHWDGDTLPLEVQIVGAATARISRRAHLGLDGLT